MRPSGRIGDARRFARADAGVATSALGKGDCLKRKRGRTAAFLRTRESAVRLAN